MRFIKHIMKILILCVVLVVFTGWGFAWYRTVRAERSPNQKIFSDGVLPSPPPDGFYAGRVAGYHGGWRGKSFEPGDKTGINIFGEHHEKKYPFVFYEAASLRDASKKVLRIDYNVPANPFWLRTVTDEVVEYEPGKYIGKLNVRWLPGVPFTLGYFFLEK